MGLTDSAFVVGPVLGLPVAVLVLAVACLTDRVVRQRVLVGGLAVLVLVLVVAYWGTWWFAFDPVPDVPGETVPNDLFPVSILLVHASAAATAALVVLTAGLALARVVGRRGENRSPAADEPA